MFHSLYNRKKPALHHHSPSKEKRLIKNQPDSVKSARFSQISKIPLNQQVSRESARFSRIGKTLRICSTPRIRRILAHGFPPTSHRPPQPATARGSQPGRVLHRQEAFRTSSGSWAIDRAGPEPLLSDCSLDVLCPFVDLLVYGHRPFSLAHGLSVYVLCLRALSFYACGPFCTYTYGPLPSC